MYVIKYKYHPDYPERTYKNNTLFHLFCSNIIGESHGTSSPRASALSSQV